MFWFLTTAKETLAKTLIMSISVQILLQGEIFFSLFSKQIKLSMLFLQSNLKQKYAKLECYIYMLNIQNQTIWPNTTFNGIPLKKTLQANELVLTHFTLPKKAVQYIAYICHTKKYSTASFQQCLSVASKYLSKAPSSQIQSIQLVLLASLLLVTKILQTDNLTISELHQLSNHCFTNRNIHLMQGKICESIDFGILSDGIPSRKIKTILEMIKHTLPEHCHYYLDSISQDVQIIFWIEFYSRPFQTKQFVADLIPLAIVQFTLILMTQSNGSFPQIAWISTLLQIKKEKIQQFTSKYLKIILGKQVTKSLFI